MANLNINLSVADLVFKRDENTKTYTFRDIRNRKHEIISC